MTDLEKAAVKVTLKDLAEKDIPLIIEAEIEKVPESYKGIVKALWEGMKPSLIAMIDAKIEGI